MYDFIGVLAGRAGVSAMEILEAGIGEGLSSGNSIRLRRLRTSYQISIAKHS